MYGAVKYAQTQYAQTSSLAEKWKTFLEYISLTDNKNIGVRKSWQSAISLTEQFNLSSLFSLTENLVVTDVIRQKTTKIMQELISISESLQRLILSLLVESLEISDVFVSVWTRTKLVIEYLSVSAILGKNIVRSWLENLSLTETYLGRPSGVIFTEFVALTESVIQGTAKMFQNAISTLDVIRLQLNGFLLRWAKRAYVSTTWAKKEFPTNTWTKKDRRSVED